MMKKILYTLSLCSVLTMTGCGLDNRDEPESTIRGRVVYDGEPVGVRGTGEAVQLQLFQDGYELRNPVPVYVTQDGSFEIKIFDGEYKLVTRNNNGPWVNDRDTTVVRLQGMANVDIEVTPLFTLSNVALSLSGGSLSASFQVDQVTQGWDIDYATIVVGRTLFVDDVSYTARRDLRDIDTGVLTTELLDLTENADFKNGRALYARVGLRAAGKDQSIYSQVIKIR
ncbi:MULTISPECIES: DUF3823 domain-containing protein [Sphingobacterium]|uniref:DUF3823 domain-containing protein n=1 Tax=Sphingobacterium populi TaxID=1812824 RepID=A0ABW5UEE1_9SPHI|nr:DUF3823 domain-containing protein [Sphingobacterium sp. CFCC 11742]